MLFLVPALLTCCMMGKPPVGYQVALYGNPVQQPVTVVRDAQGVAHIYADNAPDLFFGLGYTMAQDRLFQMDMYRHVAMGSLSEWFGNLSLGKGVSLVQLDMLLKCFEIKKFMFYITRLFSGLFIYTFYRFTKFFTIVYS